MMSSETRVGDATKVTLTSVDDPQNFDSGETIELELLCQPVNLRNLASTLTTQSNFVHELLGSELVYAPIEIITT